MDTEPKSTDMYRGYADLIEQVHSLLSILRQHAVPAREHERYTFSTTLSYSDIPEPFCDFVYPDDTSLEIDFITETDDTDLDGELSQPPASRAALEINTASKGDVRTIFVDADAGGNYQAFLVQNNGDPKPIGYCTFEAISQLILLAFQVQPSSIKDTELSVVDLLSAEKTDALRNLAEYYGFRKYGTKSYQLNNASHFTTTDTGPAELDNNTPSEIHVAIDRGIFSLDISLEHGLSIEIHQDGTKIVNPEEDLIKEIIGILNEFCLAFSPASDFELPTSPDRLEGLGKII